MALLSRKALVAAAFHLAHLYGSVQSYDINCLYPEEMPLPHQAYSQPRNIYVSRAVNNAETPIAMYWASQSEMCRSGCLAYHDDKMLNPLTLERPRVSVPSFGWNTFSRTLCVLQCYYTHGNNFQGAENSDKAAKYEHVMRDWGLGGLLRKEADMIDLVAAWTDERYEDVIALAEAEDYHPFLIGQLVAHEIDLQSKNNADGWNRDGSFVYDSETGAAVPCSANCGTFSDTTGYEPTTTTTATTTTTTNSTGIGIEAGGQDTKYSVVDMGHRWQPLVENKGYGSYVRQNHITPHIGYEATSKLRPLLEVEEPPYNDYRAEALEVVEQLRITAGSSRRKQMIQFYDSKVRVRGAVKQAIRNLEGVDHKSEEEKIMFEHGLNLVEHDALLSAWRGKVKHDLVRPTTVIRAWGDEELDTFGGDIAVMGSRVIRARDFEAVIRVMPHSEYPSGSAPICKAYSDYAKAYTSGHGLGEVVDIEAPFHIPNLDALTEQCGQSRIWGGMHFSASIPAGYALVDGLGKAGFDRMQDIRQGTNFTSVWRSGDPRPDPSRCTDAKSLSISSNVKVSNVKVGTRLEIYWPSYEEYYPATVTVDLPGHKYTVLYDDGYVEIVDLAEELFYVIEIV